MMIDQNSLANESKSTTNGSFDNSINNNNEAITSLVKRTNKKLLQFLMQSEQQVE